MALAYYACIHMYAAGIASLVPGVNVGKHEGLLQAGLFHALPNAPEKRKGKIETNLNLLNSLRKRRGDVQYELGLEVTRGAMQTCLDDAHAIIDNLFNVGKWVAEVPQAVPHIPVRK